MSWDMRDWHAEMEDRLYAHLAAIDPRILRLYGTSNSKPVIAPSGGFDLRERDDYRRDWRERPESDPVILRENLGQRSVHYSQEHDAHVTRYHTRHVDLHVQHDAHIKARKHHVWERHWEVQRQMEAHAWDHSVEDLAEDFFPHEAEGRVYGEAEYIYSHRDAVDGHRWHNLRF